MNEMTNVTTGEVRFSYVHVFKPYAAQPGQEERYSVTVLVPKTDTDTMARINAAIEAAKQRGVSDKWNGVCPPIVPTPVYDGDGVRPSDPYMFGGKKGIGCGLGPVQKLRDGEALGGSSMTAAQAFGAPQPAAPAQPMYAASQPQQSAGQAHWGQPATAPVNPLTGMPY